MRQFYIFASLICFVAWVTHIATCVTDGKAQGEVVGCAAGALFFPLGILHGFYLWAKYFLT